MALCQRGSPVHYSWKCRGLGRFECCRRRSVQVCLPRVGYRWFVNSRSCSNTSTATPSPTRSVTPTSTPHHHHSTQVGTIVGATVGGTTIAAIIGFVLCIRCRRRRRVRESLVDDDWNDSSNTPPSKVQYGAGHNDPEPFILTAPSHDRTVLASEKAGPLQRTTHLPQFYSDNGTSSDPLSNPAAGDAVGVVSVPQTRQDAGDSDALHALERRLEMRLGHLVHTLFNSGETMSNPPEYDDNGTDHHLVGDNSA